MNSIYIESKTLLENKQAVEWLDKSGAKKITDTFNDDTKTILVCKNKSLFKIHPVDVHHIGELKHTPTALEFCQGVSRILGIPEPTFGEVTGHVLTQNEIDKIIEFDKPESKTYPHKSYRILESLDDISLDTRIPLSEWIPPQGENVFVISSDGKFFYGSFSLLTTDSIQFKIADAYHTYSTIDGHWMRIV